METSLDDGSIKLEKVTDYVWDIPLPNAIERALRFNVDFRKDIISPACRASACTDGPFSDFSDGSAWHEKYLMHRSSTDVNLGFMYYADGLGINNPIGAFRNNHNLMVSYVAVVNLSHSHRMALHNIFLMTVAEKCSYVNWPAERFVYGQPDEEDTSSSFGMAMKRSAPHPHHPHR